MATGSIWDSRIRKLLIDDLPSIRAHLLRLDRDSLQLRFGNAVNDTFLVEHVARLPDCDAIVLGCCVNGAVRGVAELRRFGAGSEHQAEAAFTVEGPFIDLGMGTALMAAVIAEARCGGVSDILTCFDIRNGRMRRVAQKFDGSVSVDGSECVGRISIENTLSSSVHDLSSFEPRPCNLALERHIRVA
jgi:hypothetical protein